MQRLIAFIVIAIALTPNTGNGAELGLGEALTKNDARLDPQYAQSFDGNYTAEPAKIAERKLSKKTEKIMTYMARMGIDNAGVKKMTYYVNDHIEDDNFRIAKGEYKGFTMQFSHEVAMPSANKFRLRLTNEDMPHWDMTGSSRGLMLNYKYEFK